MYRVNCVDIGGLGDNEDGRTSSFLLAFAYRTSHMEQIEPIEHWVVGQIFPYLNVLLCVGQADLPPRESSRMFNEQIVSTER